VNVIITQLDSGHVMHATACTWLERNGVVRIMAQTAYPNQQPTRKVAARLAEACGHPSHALLAPADQLCECTVQAL